MNPQRRLHVQVEAICEADPTTAPSLATDAGTKLSLEVLRACPPERAGGVTGLSTLDLWGSPHAHRVVANSEAVGNSICSCQQPSSLPQPELAELAREAKVGASLPLGRDLVCATGSSWQRLKAESSWEEGVIEEFLTTRGPNKLQGCRGEGPYMDCIEIMLRKPHIPDKLA